ncbi:hypothetical protein L6164_017953 [Bauhinia variegata]|uniref:Uncharacterized protein n=1 Tax=Bauhinia variegata TaxID=167791 RepID=A0ACB9ND35_BAUVA|nr:hypothetical protein L6164_017953 [Bauhinia variegata]
MDNVQSRDSTYNETFENFTTLFKHALSCAIEAHYALPLGLKSLSHSSSAALTVINRCPFSIFSLILSLPKFPRYALASFPTTFPPHSPEASEIAHRRRCLSPPSGNVRSDVALLFRLCNYFCLALSAFSEARVLETLDPLQFLSLWKLF